MRVGYLLCVLLCIHCTSVLAKASVWKVSNGKNTLYLAGTIHVLSKADYPLPQQYLNAYQDASVLAFEVDLKKTESQAFQQKVVQQGMYQAGTNIEPLLKPTTIHRLKQHLASEGINYQAWAQFKPGLLSIMLTMRQLAKNGVSEEGVDKFWYLKARADGKSISALETIDEQLAFMLSMGKGMENQMITQTLDDIAQLSSVMPEMVSAWRKGDMQALSAVALDSWKSDYPGLYQDLLVERNLNWIPELHTYLQTPETEMVLVGVLHMPGQDGLLALLKKKGYQISQM